MAELKPYHPSLRDRLAQMLMGDEKPSAERRRFVEGLTGGNGLGMRGPGIADFLPGGQIMAVDEAMRDSDPQAMAMAAMPLPGARLTPAVKAAGKTYRGKDHFGALSEMLRSAPPEHAEQAKRAWTDGNARGFVDDRGRFLNRERAQTYAVENELLSPDAPSWAKTSPHLIAENLNPEVMDLLKKYGVGSIAALPPAIQLQLALQKSGEAEEPQQDY